MTELEQIKVTKPTRKEKGEVKDRMKNMMMFLPNMVKLLGNLLKDARVPTAEKALFIGAIVYVISPIDLIPDVLPFIGQVDDLYVVALTLLRLLNRTDESVVRQHWSGGGDIVGLANSAAKLAPMLLPKRISRVISSEVELAPTGKALNSLTKKKQPLVIEIPQPEDIKVDSQSALPN
jgi:uncharacterized membrane protein YkvA (DUF1232 family)